MTLRTVVVDYRKGNLKSVERGLAAAGADAFISDDPAAIAAADAVVLPGVGAFADAATTMAELGQVEAVRAAVEGGAPFLGICLGMHLMFEAGEEHAPEGGPLPAGLGLIPGVVGALPRLDEAGRAYKVPHVGWNSVEYVAAGPEAEPGCAHQASSTATGTALWAVPPSEDCLSDWAHPGSAPGPNPLFAGIPEGEHFYFTHSFAVPDGPAAIARTVHARPFTCAVQVPGHAVWGVQFHPEKSSDAGAALLRNFVRLAKDAR
ncbi:imidazole glycerol phosphate synthase subunit HisH [Enterorhabdus sp. P55]|uniref:imidazole glycerol phosphate synthase subunit HisH n=1 Tax=Enterorhabdus sp. P55 TaxID=2304571 RepID=UPI00351B0A40